MRAAGGRSEPGPAALAEGISSGFMERRGPVPIKRGAQPEEDLVRLYLTDIGKYALLTKDDEARLAQATEAGRQARGELAGAESITPSRQRELRRLIRDGEDATETFVKANLRLVVSIAKKYQAAELPLLDLVQEGNLGLIHAVEKFDWRKGFKFSTYATWWIRQAITRGIANSGSHRAAPGPRRRPADPGDQGPRPSGRAAGPAPDGRGAGRRPASCDEGRVTEILRHAGEPLSLSEPLREDGDAELGDMVEDRARSRPSTPRPPPCSGTRSTRCWSPSTSGSGRSSGCASVWTGASPAPSTRSASTST